VLIHDSFNDKVDPKEGIDSTIDTLVDILKGDNFEKQVIRIVMP
jgi:NADPH-dependent curcumin reductase CurA